MEATSQIESSQQTDKESAVDRKKQSSIFSETKTLPIEELIGSQNLEQLLDLIAEKQQANTKTSLRVRVKEQLSQWGASTITSLIALSVAIIVPLVLNSQFVQDMTSAINDIREELPDEADALLMSQLTERSNNNQSRLMELTQKHQILELQSNDLKTGNQAFAQQYNEVMTRLIEINAKSENIQDSTQKVKQLESQIQKLQAQVENGLKGVNQRLYRQLVKLSNEGEKINQNQTQKAQLWFKKILYTVQGLQNKNTQSHLKAHVDVLKNIVNGSGEFSQFSNRKQEALLILNALSSLANAAVIR